jgi:hypothetical protein
MSTLGYAESSHSLVPTDETPSGTVTDTLSTTVTLTREDVPNLRLLSSALPDDGDVLRVDIRYVGDVHPTLLADGVRLVGVPVGRQVLSFRVDASQKRTLSLGDVPFTQIDVSLLDKAGSLIPTGYVVDEREA